jgi:hypothetical protein
VVYQDVAMRTDLYKLANPTSSFDEESIDRDDCDDSEDDGDDEDDGYDDAESGFGDAAHDVEEEDE